MHVYALFSFSDSVDPLGTPTLPLFSKTSSGQYRMFRFQGAMKNISAWCQSNVQLAQHEHRCVSLNLFFLIEQQVWCQSCLNIQPFAASLVPSSCRVSSDTAVPAAWISHNKVITHVTLNHLHHWVQSLNFHQVWQNLSLHFLYLSINI